MSDFWIQGNNGKKENLNGIKSGVRKDQVDKKYQNLFDVFDADHDGTIDEKEAQIIESWFSKAAGEDNTLDEEENRKQISIFAKEAGIENADFMGFVKSVSTAGESETVVLDTETKTEAAQSAKMKTISNTETVTEQKRIRKSTNVPTTQEQAANACKETVISIIDDNISDAEQTFQSQSLGVISGAYDDNKSNDNKLKTSNVQKVLDYQRAGEVQMVEAKNGNLTRRAYYEENKQRIKDMILTRLNVLKTTTGTSYFDDLRGKYSKEELTKIINNYVDELCKNADMEKLKGIQKQFVTYSAAKETSSLKNFVSAAKKFAQTVPIQYEGMKQIKIETPKIPQYWDSAETITFEEVYKLERGTEYSQSKVEAYVLAKKEMETVVNAFNKKQQFVDFAKNLQDKNISSTEKAKSIMSGFAEFYALSTDNGQSQLQKIIDESKLSIKFDKDGLDLSAYKDEKSKQDALNKLLKIAAEQKEKDFQAFLGDKTIEEYQQALEQKSLDILGGDNAKLLTEAMKNDNLGVIQRYTGNASMAGMGLTVVGGVLCFTPLAPLGAVMVTVGNTVAVGGMVAKNAAGIVDYATKDVQTSEELSELTKGLIMDAGGFIVGYGAGKAGMKAFNNLIDKKLTAVFAKEITAGNRTEALKTVFKNPAYLKSFMKAAGAKISTDFLISYAGDLAMMGVLDTNDDWKSLLQANLTGVLVGMSGDIKDASGVGKHKKVKPTTGTTSGKLVTEYDYAQSAGGKETTVKDPQTGETVCGVVTRAYTTETGEAKVEINGKTYSTDDIVEIKEPTTSAIQNTKNENKIETEPQAKENTSTEIQGSQETKAAETPEEIAAKREEIKKMLLSGKTQEQIISDAAAEIKTKDDMANFLESLEEIEPVSGKNEKVFTHNEAIQLLEKYNDQDFWVIRRLLQETIDKAANKNYIGSSFKKILENFKLLNVTSDDLKVIEKYLNEESTNNSDELIDAVVYDRTYILTDHTWLINLSKLYEIKESSDNPILNVDNIYKMANLLHRDYPIDTLKGLFNAKDEKGNYILNAKNFPNQYERVDTLMKIYEQKKQLFTPAVVNYLNKSFGFDEEYGIITGASRIEKIITENPGITEKELMNKLKELSADKLITNPLLKSISEKCEDKQVNERLNELQFTIENIKDEKINNEINKELEDMNTWDSSSYGYPLDVCNSLLKLQALADAYHMANGDYVAIGTQYNMPYYREFIKYIKEKRPDIAQELVPDETEVREPGFMQKFMDRLNKIHKFLDEDYEDNYDVHNTFSPYETLKADFERDMQIGKIVEICKNDPKSDIGNYLYKEYFINCTDMPQEMKSKCLEINEKYGVKIIPSSDTSEFPQIADYVEKEFAQWKQALGDDAKYPPVLDFMEAKKNYFDNTSAYGQGTSAGFAESGSISRQGMSLSRVQYALRHELTHINDTTKEVSMSTEAFNKSDNIMPKTSDNKIDFERCLYREEFIRAGIIPGHVEYAYNNPAEFIAVAAEGDMSKYSPEFKKLLISFGMPKEAFNMETINPDVIERVKEVETLEKENPGISLTDYYYKEKPINFHIKVPETSSTMTLTQPAAAPKTTETPSVHDSESRQNQTPADLSKALDSAAARKDFAAIRDEIKKLPNGEEKQALVVKYQTKYREWSSDPARPNIRNQYIPEDKNSQKTEVTTSVETKPKQAEILTFISEDKTKELFTEKFPDAAKYTIDNLIEDCSINGKVCERLVNEALELQKLGMGIYEVQQTIQCFKHKDIIDETVVNKYHELVKDGVESQEASRLIYYSKDKNGNYSEYKYNKLTSLKADVYRANSIISSIREINSFRRNSTTFFNMACFYYIFYFHRLDTEFL